MLAELLRAEGERRRGALAALGVLALAVPGVYLARLGEAPADFGAQLEAAQRLSTGLGLVLALAAMVWGVGVWTPERRGRWVYALSLPVERERLFALRYAAGLAWLAAVVGVLVVTSYGVAAALSLPPGVYGYPGAAAAWAVLACWLAYSLGFVAGARFAQPELVLPLAFLVLFVALPLLLFRAFQATAGVATAYTPLRLLAEAAPLVGY